MSEGLPKSARVRKRGEYSEMQQGRRLASAHFVIFLRERPVHEAEPTPCSRLGLIVSRKVGNAVLRNRVKRRCRELFRRRHGELLGAGWDFVVLARHGAADLPLAEVEKEWRRALSKLRGRPQ